MVTENQKKPLTLHILRSRGTHTQLLLATSEKGKVATEKGTISELSKGNGKFHKETKRNFDEKRL